MLITHNTFEKARKAIVRQFLTNSYEVETSRWQGIDVSTKPEMRMREVFSYSFHVPLRSTEDPAHWALDTDCNLPFADVHFAERVSRQPTNPGEAWKIWPWGHNAAKFLEAESGNFSHTYQERFWPKYANLVGEGPQQQTLEHQTHRGIRYRYGDLDDLVNHLAADPFSRQAYLPIWFPEDGTCTGRKPCTLGYHFLHRGDYLNITYHIRSCDFIRHWADDCYLAIRLLLWVLDELRKKDDRWKMVVPGIFTMHIGSLHCFVNDFRLMQQVAAQEKK